MTEWFWARVLKGDDCWQWMGWRNAKGYGMFHRHGPPPHKTLYAHRLSWELANGPVPSGLCVCHRCDNPPCVRPDHLFLGTRTENHADMVAKGRHVRGEGSPSAKLTIKQVRAIRRLLDTGLSHRRLAAMFGVSQPAITHISTGKTWASAA